MQESRIHALKHKGKTYYAEETVDEICSSEECVCLSLDHALIPYLTKIKDNKNSKYNNRHRGKRRPSINTNTSLLVQTPPPICSGADSPAPRKLVSLGAQQAKLRVTSTICSKEGYLLVSNKEGYLLVSHNEGYLLVSSKEGYPLVSHNEGYLLVSSKEGYLLVNSASADFMKTTQLLNSNKGMQLLVSTRKDAPADEQCIC
ncbi:hypothetical protein F511_16114 [Dorcoceras hygrometricum]|uniref:DELLA protein GAIP-like n=1 Tax=Dorcoceras hygrometricum TaxID=472368 RepID=A0A2Z7D1J7_9LAMI|nr:hypothetical protein F511_16114 [Dorcoceras hygrometricum]